MKAEWRPVAEERIDTVTAVAAAALHGLLDAPGEPPGEGEPLPPLWHWLAFLPDSPQRELDLDGHPRRGTFWPPELLPRRMFAGASLHFDDALTVGTTLQRRSMVRSVSEKQGRSGRLQFIDVSNEITGRSQLAVDELQSVVHREPATEPTTPAAALPESRLLEEDTWEWHLELGTEPSLLFRFSALTYNAHRIHYDREYATGVEGYSGLVVHGPLQAIGLAELCRRNAGRQLVSFKFKALRPAFDGVPLRLRGRWSGQDSAELAAIDRYGQRTMVAEAAFVA